MFNLFDSKYTVKIFNSETIVKINNINKIRSFVNPDTAAKSGLQIS